MNAFESQTEQMVGGLTNEGVQNSDLGSCGALYHAPVVEVGPSF